MKAAVVWFGVLGGAVAWTVHLSVSYAVVPFACGTDRVWILHGLTVLAALVAAAATAAGWGVRRRRPGRSEASDAGSAGAPSRAVRMEGFLALAAILLSGFFLLLILVEGLPALLTSDPCAAVPTPDRPIILADPPPLLVLAMAVHAGGLVGPGEVWSAWSRNLWVLGAIYLATAAYLLGVRRLWASAGRGRGIPRWRVWAYLGGVAALVVALLSPVDALGHALFSVHMVQHMLLMVVAAPLLVLGRPALGCLWALPGGGRRRVGLWWRRRRGVRVSWALVSHPLVVFLLHVGALWVWHVPRFYEAALVRPWVHHLEHASFFLTAALFWWALAEAGARGRWPGYGAGILYVFATALQSGALGALLLFAPDPWYPAHAAGAAAWGIDLLVDQQMAGAVMWIPAGLVYTAAAGVLFVAWLGKADRASARRERAGWAMPPPGGRVSAG